MAQKILPATERMAATVTVTVPVPAAHKHTYTEKNPIMIREFPKNGHELYLISSSHKTKPCIDTN